MSDQSGKDGCLTSGGPSRKCLIFLWIQQTYEKTHEKTEPITNDYFHLIWQLRGGIFLSNNENIALWNPLFFVTKPKGAQALCNN